MSKNKKVIKNLTIEVKLRLIICDFNVGHNVQ